MELVIKICVIAFTIIMFIIAPAIAMAAKTEMATFAGGCFWSMQHDFDKVPGVMKTIVGYTGGHVTNPTYDQVSAGDTGHYEAIEVIYDPSKISYKQLVNFYWHDIDPSDANGQFCDHGNEYHTAIFYHNAEQQKIDLASKYEFANSQRFKQIATLIRPAQTFYPAEEYHQKYAKKNPVAYASYRLGCGRDQRIKEIWGAS